MANTKVFITVLFCFVVLFTSGQKQSNPSVFMLTGKVLEKDTRSPISGVSVTTSKGHYDTTNSFGQFKVQASIGEEIIIEDFTIETIRYTIHSREEILILVEAYEGSNSLKSSRSGTNNAQRHHSLLDSADFYKTKDIQKSIDFVRRSISLLGKSWQKKELARSLSKLGEIYVYHNQQDFAIEKFEEALAINKTIATSLLLAKSYNDTKSFTKSDALLKPLIELKKMPPYQRVLLYELLGDAKKGLGEVSTALYFYNEGLVVAEKNQMTPKLTDLNSKIADAYSQANQVLEAESYYANSLQLASKLAPQRALQEKEKVADFYNKKSRFKEEISLRKKSLEALNKLESSGANQQKVGVGDTLTSQRINYKIANAYISQDKYNEAIPFLERSILEADDDDDLMVQKDATKTLSEVYKVKGDFDKALNSYQSYVSLVDSLYVKKEQEIATASRINKNIARIQSRIAGLEQERELSQSKYNLAMAEQELAKENYKRQQWVIYSLIFGLLLTLTAAFFYYRSNKQQKISNNLLALKSLRSQMNPHFIFNALNSVNNFIAKNDERSANRYLSNFSTLMRSVLENSEEDFIPLTKELEQLEIYMKLEHARFPDKFEYKISVSKDTPVAAYRIPPMLLQPYVENAIWHGLRYKESKGLLKVTVAPKSDTEISICISDNGIGRKRSAELKTQNQKKQNSKGMSIIQKRVAILNDMYSDRVTITINDLQKDGSGTKVLFILKKDQSC